MSAGSTKGKDVESATIVAENTFSNSIQMKAGDSASVSAQPGAATTVTLQRQMDGTNWRDVVDITADEEGSYTADEACLLRIGVKTGNYGASTPVRVGKG
jgi:hypothetical protein